MGDSADMTAIAARDAITMGRLSPAALMEACLARVAAREPVLAAMACVEPALAWRAAEEALAGPLHGLPLGVKDVLDTSDMPTEYGSPIWRGWQPRADAAAVAWARAAGAAVLGKTITTEFATRQPGPTTNPCNAAHTPGGSSSGSAAGVAAGYFPFAFGTQTAGSVIRPAAYCGVVGFKPTFGTIDRRGMKLMSFSLDTIGVMARSVGDCALLTGAVSGCDMGDPERACAPPRIGLCRPPAWDMADAPTRALLADAGERLRRAGASVVECEPPMVFGEVAEAQAVLMNAESARAMGWEMLRHRDRLSAGLREKLEWGLSRSPAQVMAAHGVVRSARAALPAAMAGVDVLLTPSAPGEAPAGLGWTGDPAFNLVWTALHVPCVTVPAGLGPAGLPLGLQVVGRVGSDAATLAAAHWIGAALCWH